MSDRDAPAQVQDLHRGEKLVVWAMRVWVVGARERITVDEILRGSFARCGVPTALPVLDNMMAVIAGGAARTIDIACVCHDRVSPDELCIMDVIALYQAGDTLETPLMLRSFLTPGAADATAALIDRLARILSDAGLRLRTNPCRTRRYVMDASTARAGWAGPMTVH